jgi:hypothetical protein
MSAHAQRFVYGQRVGNQTFYHGGHGFSGHSTTIGNQTFYHGSHGVRGHSLNVGNQTFYNSGSSRNRVGSFQSFGSMQVRTFRRKYSSSR